MFDSATTTKGRRLLSAAAIVCACCAAAALPAKQGEPIMLRMDAVEAEPGAMANVPVWFMSEPGATPVSTLIFTVVYDPASLTFQGLEIGEILERPEVNKDVQYSEEVDGQLAIAISGGQSALPSGALLALQFQVASGIEAALLDLALVNVSLASPDAEPVLADTEDGRIIVGDAVVVAVTPNPASVATGGQVTLAASSTDPGDTSFAWYSDAEGVAQVNAAGVVTGVSAGSATISAVGGHSGVAGQAVVNVHCALEEIPGNVQASDGTRGDGVLVAWTGIATAGAEYRVYRGATDAPSAAVALGAWQTAVTFLDTSAAGPEMPPMACFAPAGPAVPAYYYYWVKARTPGGCESDLAGPDQGYRGAAAKRAVWGAQAAPAPTAMPAAMWDADLRWAFTNNPLAVRLAAEDAVDSTTVWGMAEWGHGQTQWVYWQPVADSDGTDGWIVCVPQSAWPVGAVVTVTGGAFTVTGAPVEASAAFYVADPAAAPKWPGMTSLAQPAHADLDWSHAVAVDAAMDAAVVAQLGAGAPEVALGAVGPVLFAGPDQLFETPRRVWLPLPGPNEELTLRYWHAGAQTWVDAAAVAGFIVPGSELEVDWQGRLWRGYVIQHGARVQWARQAPTDAAAMTGGPGGGLWTLLLAAVAAMLVTPRWAKRRG